VQNFTDIEEVIIRRAAERGSRRSISRSSSSTRPRGHEGPERPAATHYPKVTQHIPEIIGSWSGYRRGYAYAIDGEVYFRTKKAKHSFGILSHRKIEDIVVDAVPQGSRREDPLDFALWKRSKEGEPSWPSPWGEGRPGWHVECNAMAYKYLGAPSTSMAADSISCSRTTRARP